jgi:RHS repeat-associated protein
VKAWRAFLFVLLLVWSATGLLARPTHSFSSSCHLEGLGSVRYLTDATGIITDTFTYDAFGILIERRARTSGGVLTPFANPALETPPANTSPTVNNYRYTGEQWDQDLGMYYLRARYYKPDLGMCSDN